MKIVLWFGAVLLIFGAVASFELMHFKVPTNSLDSISSTIVALDGVQIHVVLARTVAEQQRGLGGRSSLAQNEGMLFVFAKDDKYAFWMKNMNIPIDIIWLAVDGTVVDMAQNVSPDSYPQSFSPKKAARFVLEVTAGFVQQNTVQIGDVARLP